ncbi:uncharacterized protein LOC124434268 [Xenia sp. Carnegie-2017]|uniref:uncharacterized protein LOC124434268 n=1 Tax=Xenia sp. Carnegie-2017 TaxID=2897299 RepID=UPI001F0420A8|nr:uncharacterized protein LOC124434268 [Xenia sp. Carnegie-2017]XP_046840109.1 uncharacterized protein LOC124434268 [Xenia sp. Carnegie-2017]
MAVDFVEMENVGTENLSFNSRQFQIIRFFLRLLSLWRPASASFVECYVYPMLVNLLLITTGPIRNLLRTLKEPSWPNVEIVFMGHEIAVWLGHILGNRYFSTRDLETNVLKPKNVLLVEVQKPLYRMIKRLNIAVVFSTTFFTIMLWTLFYTTRTLSVKGDERFSSQTPHIHGVMDRILYALVPFLIFYDLGIGLALSWTLGLLYCSYAARLKILENVFLKWKDSADNAVSLFIHVYAHPVQRSWKRISLWFLVHNIVVLVLPLYGYSLAQAITGRAYHSKHLPEFICYFVFTMTIWLTPIFIGQLFKSRECKFSERINNISPWLLEVHEHDVPRVTANCGTKICNDFQSSSSHENTKGNLQNNNDCATTSTDNVANYDEYTFVKRGKEFQNFRRFLKGRTLGLVSYGYAVQLNLSLVSFIGAVISFILQINHWKSGEMTRNIGNCTA